MKTSSRSPCAVRLALTGSCAPGTRVLHATFRTVRLLLLQAAESSTNEKARQTRNFVLQAARIGGIMHKAAPCSRRPTRPVLLLLVGRHTTQPYVIRRGSAPLPFQNETPKEHGPRLGRLLHTRSELGGGSLCGWYHAERIKGARGR